MLGGASALEVLEGSSQMAIGLSIGSKISEFVSNINSNGDQTNLYITSASEAAFYAPPRDVQAVIGIGSMVFDYISLFQR